MSKAKNVSTTAVVETTQVETNAIVAMNPETPITHEDTANAIVTIKLSNAHKTNTAIILKKGSTDSVDGKERWFAKKDLKSFKLVDGKWHVEAPAKYFYGKLTAFENDGSV